MTEKKPNLEKIIENYDSTKTDGKEITIDGFKDFFESLDKTICGKVAKCKLKSKGCLADYAGDNF